MKVRIGFSMGLLTFLCFALPGSLSAGPIYTYTGNAYATCSGAYQGSTAGSCAGALSITFEVNDGTALNNLALFVPGSGYDISTAIKSFVISDHKNVTIYSTDSGIGTSTFQIGTNAIGEIQSWYIVVIRRGGEYTWLAESNGSIIDRSEASRSSIPSYGGSGFIQGHPGSWVGNSGTGVVPNPDPAPVPEPATLTLLGLGLAGLGFGKRGKARLARRDGTLDR